MQIGRQMLQPGGMQSMLPLPSTTRRRRLLQRRRHSLTFWEPPPLSFSQLREFWLVSWHSLLRTRPTTIGAIPSTFGAAFGATSFAINHVLFFVSMFACRRGGVQIISTRMYLIPCVRSIGGKKKNEHVDF